MRDINSNKFNKDSLSKAPWQYRVRHHETKAFEVGDQVFLKSNPETVLIVRRIASKPNKLSEGIREAVYVSRPGSREQYGFPPECILQYKYAGLLISSHGKFEINLN